MRIIKPSQHEKEYAIVYNTKTKESCKYNSYTFYTERASDTWKVDDNYTKPTLEDFKKFYEDNRLKGNYKKLYQAYDYCLWLDGYGNRIKDSVWKQALKKGDINIRLNKKPILIKE